LENDIQVELFDEQEAFADVTELSKITSVQNSIKDLELLKSSEGLPQYPVVTFLGTGSSVPSKYRCVSSILVETEPDNFIILDCGEGTLLQIHRQLGREVK
jgi:ribonuclease Z